VETRFSHDDPRFIWVAPLDEATGDGSFKKPFGRITSSLSAVQPGQTIVLKTGTYQGDVTVQVCGTIDNPIRIVADTAGEAILYRSCWYFYDASDIIVSGLVFKEASSGAISVVGACERNRFESLKFLNCGCSEKASCTFFFGGAGAACNMVEQCVFERQPRPVNEKKRADEAVIGLMISEGDRGDEGLPIKDHIIKNNGFSNYDYGILVGADDATMKEYGHLIAYNTIDNCFSEGIMVKCGDTQVKGNVLKKCAANSISIVAGQGTVVDDNRILDSGVGIRIAGKGHTVSNNCIVRCRNEAIRVMEPLSNGATTENVFIEQNTLVNWFHNNSSPPLPAISIGRKTNAIVKKNLFFGQGTPYRLDDGNNETPGAKNKQQRHLITDNISSEPCETLPGIEKTGISFHSEQNDNYENQSGYGAQGWMCGPKPYDPAMEEI
jgi:hypothetical protein